MATHDAVVTVAARAPYEIHRVPTVTPKEGQVRIKVQYAVSTPLDLHMADGGLLVKHPKVMGSGFGGVVVEVHPSVTTLQVGDSVVGFGVPKPDSESNGHQIYVTVPSYFAGRLPTGMSMKSAITTTGSLITVWHAMLYDFGLDLPWPKPDNYVPAHADEPILIWGGSGSVGLFAVQVFRHWGYRKIFATASKRNHALLRDLGATHLFDYNDVDVLEQIKTAAGGKIPYFLDCIGHLTGSVEPISKLAEAGSKVAIVLPVILRDASDDVKPEYAMEAEKVTEWAAGVKVSGIRAHFYDQSPLLRDKATPEMTPMLLESGAIKPLAYREVEGATLLERATNALDILRAKGASAERLVWRVAEE